VSGFDFLLLTFEFSLRDPLRFSASFAVKKIDGVMGLGLPLAACGLPSEVRSFLFI
jgi:hypothetical protein